MIGKKWLVTTSGFSGHFLLEAVLYSSTVSFRLEVKTKFSAAKNCEIHNPSATFKTCGKVT